MLDTIWCSVPVFIHPYIVSTWQRVRFANKYKDYCYINYNGISFRYYYNNFRNKMPCPLLWMDFSTATIQNGVNMIRYNFSNSKNAVKEIEKTIEKVVGFKIPLKSINCISRIDINRDFSCKSETEKQELFNFHQKIKGHSGMRQKIYPTGVTVGNSQAKMKFYFKDEDVNLGEEICAYMPRLCRTEFQLKRSRIEKYYPKGLNLYTLLTDELQTAKAWNAMVDEFSVGGKIYNQNTLNKKAKQLFKNRKNIRDRKLRQLKQINNPADKVTHRKQTIMQSKGVAEELNGAGICPFSCETALSLKIGLIGIIIKKTTAENKGYYFVAPRFCKQVVIITKYLDSS